MVVNSGVQPPALRSGQSVAQEAFPWGRTNEHSNRAQGSPEDGPCPTIAIPRADAAQREKTEWSCESRNPSLQGNPPQKRACRRKTRAKGRPEGSSTLLPFMTIPVRSRFSFVSRLIHTGAMADHTHNGEQGYGGRSSAHDRFSAHWIHNGPSHFLGGAAGNE